MLKKRIEKKMALIVLFSCFVLFFVIFLAKPVLALIIFDSNSSGSRTSFGSPTTFSHTVNANTSGILIVITNQVDPDNVFNVTYAGNNLTKVISIQTADYKNAAIWYLLNPQVGTNDITISHAATSTMKGIGASFIGVNQSSPIGASTSATSASGAPSKEITTTAANSFIISTVSQADSNPGSAGSGQSNITPNLFGNSHWAAATYEEKATAGADTQSWTTGGSSGWSMVSAEIMAEIQPCTPPATNSNWNVSMSDYCIISSSVNLGTGNLTFYNNGNFTINSTLSVKNMQNPNANQYIFIKQYANVSIG
jgi:hypothetical protein